jgi:hypothetical protein
MPCHLGQLSALCSVSQFLIHFRTSPLTPCAFSFSWHNPFDDLLNINSILEGPFSPRTTERDFDFEWFRFGINIRNRKDPDPVVKFHCNFLNLQKFHLFEFLIFSHKKNTGTGLLKSEM